MSPTPFRPEDDEAFHELMGRVHRGDASAMHELAVLEHAYIMEAASRKLGARARRYLETGDLAHAVVVRILETSRLPTAETRLSFRAWLCKTTLNTMQNLVKYEEAQKRGAGAARESWLEEQPVASVSPGARPATDPADRADRNEEVQRLEELLARLEAEDNELLRWRYSEDLSYPEIVERLNARGGSPPVTADGVRMRIQRLRKRLMRNPDPRT